MLFRLLASVTCSQKKADLISVVKKSTTEVVGAKEMDVILHVISDGDENVLVYIAKEKPGGELLEK